MSTRRSADNLSRTQIRDRLEQLADIPTDSEGDDDAVDPTYLPEIKRVGEMVKENINSSARNFFRSGCVLARMR